MCTHFFFSIQTKQKVLQNSDFKSSFANFSPWKINVNHESTFLVIISVLENNDSHSYSQMKQWTIGIAFGFHLITNVSCQASGAEVIVVNLNWYAFQNWICLIWYEWINSNCKSNYYASLILIFDLNKSMNNIVQ